MTIHCEYLFFEIITSNSNHNFEVIVLGEWIGINQMSLSVTLNDYKNRQLFRMSKLFPKTWVVPPKTYKGLTQWDFVTLWVTLIYIIE